MFHWILLLLFITPKKACYIVSHLRKQLLSSLRFPQISDTSAVPSSRPNNPNFPSSLLLHVTRLSTVRMFNAHSLSYFMKPVLKSYFDVIMKREVLFPILLWLGYRPGVRGTIVRMQAGQTSGSAPPRLDSLQGLIIQIYNTSLLDKYLQSQLLCLLTFTSLSHNMFRPHGPSSGDHNQTFSTYLQEDFFPQRIRCL
jgi:hypothetical protein